MQLDTMQPDTMQPDTMQPDTTQQQQLKKPNSKRAKVVPYSQTAMTLPGYNSVSSLYNPIQPDTMKKQQPHNNTSFPSRWRQSTRNLQNEWNNSSLQPHQRVPSNSIDGNRTDISNLNSQIREYIYPYP